LDWEGAIIDIQAAVDFLKNTVGCETVGIVGFCMGGALSLRSATLVSGLGACAFYYGIPEGLDVSKLSIPIQV
jgi:carboxymethylenebutenolidase